MAGEIITALIGLGGSALGSIIGIIANSRVTAYRLKALENWLDNNEVYILAPLVTPIITELSKEEVDKILSLHTYYPNTTIIADSDCQVGYIADTKSYIDNKFNELATALVAHESEVM